MKFLSRMIGIILFILFFGFALKNTQEVALRFFLGYEVHAPLVLMLLAFFAGGAILGVLAMTPTVVRYRRSNERQKNAAMAVPVANVPQQAESVQSPQPGAY
jgi:lipopolysaccharide assembly protein A